MRLDAKARALNATFTALSCNKGALCMRAFWFDAKQPLSMQHSHLSFASETELCIDQPCIAKDASAMHDNYVMKAGPFAAAAAAGLEQEMLARPAALAPLTAGPRPGGR